MSFPGIQAGKPALVLAPMEGVTDAPMRALMTERGGWSFCVAEFLRVGGNPIPAHVFHGHVPELSRGCLTPSGTPVQVQILGGDEERMAEAAARAVELGAGAVDINFGCPSKTVNRHDGGAAILQYPNRVYSIAKAVRGAVRPEIPVSVKMRLGWDNTGDIHRNAEQAAKAGISWLTIHARTKSQGYAPPVNWRLVGEVRRVLELPIVANGDVWSFEDFQRCRDETGCEHFMLGRGALVDPSLPLRVAAELQGRSGAGLSFEGTTEWARLLSRFVELNEEAGLGGDAKGQGFSLARIKQWLKFAHVKKRIDWFDEIKRTESLDQLFSVLESLDGLENLKMGLRPRSSSPSV